MFLLKTFKIRKKDYIVQAGSLVSTGQFDMEGDEKFPTAQLHTIIKLFNIPEHVMSQVSITVSYTHLTLPTTPYV